MLRYHQRSFDLIRCSPKTASESVDALTLVENRIGRPLPPSVREWYSIEGACDLLLKYSNGDPPVAIATIGSRGLISEELLVFRHENQGVCSWAVWLNGDDDPPVVVSDDLDFRSYKFCTDTFSDYIYSCVWDYGWLFVPPLIQAQNVPLSAAALEMLNRDFTRGLKTNGWPGDTQHRFFSKDHRILIWASKDQADWWLTADTGDSLADLARSLWKVDGLGRTFWANDSTGETILSQVKSERLR